MLSLPRAAIEALPRLERSEALSEVERGHASFAVVPFETSYDGAVTETLNLLARSDLKICAEIPIRRAYHLLSRGGERTAIKKVYATAGAITACEAFLAARLPGVVVIDVRNGQVTAPPAVQPIASCSKIIDASRRLNPNPPTSSGQYKEQKPSSPA